MKSLVSSNACVNLHVAALVSFLPSVPVEFIKFSIRTNFPEKTTEKKRANSSGERMDKIQLKRNGSPKTAAHEIYAMSAAVVSFLPSILIEFINLNFRTNFRA